jgi:lipopolysaccharide cholinephosphotransferase
MYKEYDDETLKKLHAVELDILNDLIKICQKYDIKYFICYGCAIGAIRHHGFIPWDDDIDVCMLRADYEKFLASADKEFAGRYEMTGPDCSKKYYNLVPNMCKIGTTFSTVYDGGKYNCGIFIDIFVFDYTYADIKPRNRQVTWTQFYRNLYLLKNANYNKQHEKGFIKNIKIIISTALHVFLNILHISNDYLYKKYLKHSTECSEKTDLVTTFNDSARLSRVSCMRLDEIFPLSDADFENLKIKLPHSCHDILTRMYGDYMKLPPLEERRNHPPYILSFDNKEIICQDL